MNYLIKCNHLAKVGIVLSTIVLISNLFQVMPLQAATTSFAEEDTTVYVVVESEPQFEGNLNQWIGDNIKYPQAAQDSMVEGRVYISFIIEKDGSVSHVTVARSVHPSLDAEAKRVMSKMPKWKPAILEGKPVRFSKTYPITFKLSTAPAEEGTANQITYEQYLDNLKKEEEFIAAGKGLSPEEQAERVEVLKNQLGDDATVYQQMLEKCTMLLGEVTSTVKKQAKALKLKKPDIKKLTEIYNNKINKKIKFIQGLGQEDFIKKFVASEVELRKMELEEVLQIQDLLKDRFQLYFEKCVLTQPQ